MEEAKLLFLGVMREKEENERLLECYERRRVSFDKRRYGLTDEMISRQAGAILLISRCFWNCFKATSTSKYFKRQTSKFHSGVNS